MGDNTTKPKVTLFSNNPYQPRFPQRRLITRDTLQLMKMLRAQGAEVRIEPENGLKIEYVFQKGFGAELLAATPVVLVAVYFARDVLVNVVSDWFSSRLKGNKPDQGGTNIAIEINEGGRRVRCAISGAEISDERFDSIMATIKAVGAGTPTTQTINSPFPDLPVPIFLEHTDKIVGWGRINPSDEGLKIENARMTDDETWQRLKSGELRGASIAAIAKESECSICGMDYVDCVHLAGQTYGGRNCTNTIKASELLEISLVKDPVNPQALIKIKKGD